VQFKESPKQFLTTHLLPEFLYIRTAFLEQAARTFAVAALPPIFEFGLPAEKGRDPPIQIMDGSHAVFHIGWQFDGNTYTIGFSSIDAGYPATLALTAER
jgi:hypothetical protein